MLKQQEAQAASPATTVDPIDGLETEEGVVSGVLLRALTDVAKRYGVEPSALFDGDAHMLMTRDPIRIRIPLGNYRRLLERAVSLTGEPAIGLICGRHASESAFDLIAPLVAHVPTLRHALREVRQFQKLFFDGAYLHASERAGIARLRWEFPRAHTRTDHSIAEFLTAGLMRMLREFGCAPSELQTARFEHRCPPYRRLYAEAFEGRERFSQKWTGIECAAQVLDRPHLHNNPVLQALIHREAEELLSRLCRPMRLVDRLRVYLCNHPVSRVPEMPVAARDLGVSVRSLRRRLAEEGLSYRRLTQEIQRNQACVLLRNGELTLQGVADALGFEDTASFHRAFKRWTGLTAGEYRNSN